MLSEPVLVDTGPLLAIYSAWQILNLLPTQL
jgi:hypothetical protein